MQGIRALQEKKCIFLPTYVENKIEFEFNGVWKKPQNEQSVSFSLFQK